jgi:hypothetical protein
MAEVTSINQIVITAKDQTGAAFTSARQNVKSLQTALADMVDGLGPTLRALTATLGAGAFGAAIADAIEFQAKLARLSETTGATVESLSAMRTAAKYSGVDMDQVSIAMARFAANVVAAQAGTGKQAAALQALGFNAKQFATQFTTTDQALLAVAQRLNQYADGLGKTAIEQALLGRSGAQLASFLRELAERGTDAAKVSTAQALAAKELEDSIIKLKTSFTDLVNRLATTLVPVLQKVVDGMGTFKLIAIAAIGAFVVWPATLTAAAATVVTFREAIALATIYNGLFGASLQNIYVALGGIRLPAELVAGGLAALRASALLLFSAFAGWEIGKWLSDNFVQAKLAGYAFVDSMLTGWENVKYGAQVAWAFLQYAFEQAIESMRQSFGSFIAWIGQGFSHIPGASGVAEALQGFAAAASGQAGAALSNFNAKLAQLGTANDAAKAKIRDITVDLMAMAIVTDAGTGAAARAARAPAPVPAGAAQAVKDLTSAIDSYLKSEATLEKAYIDANAATQLQAINSQQADLKRAYDRGVVDFQGYYDKLTALQKQAIDVQVAQAQAEVTSQQNLVDVLQSQLDHLDPSKYKTAADFQAAQLKIATDLNDANAKLITSAGKLNDVVEKGAEIGKDYVEQWNAAHSAIATNVLEINKQIEAQQFANQTIGLAASQVALLKASELEEALAVEVATTNRADQVKSLEDQIAAQQRLSGVLAKGEDIQRSIDLIKSFDQEAQSVFEDIFNNGHDAFKRVGDDIKKYLIDLIYQLTVKPIIVQLAAQVLGINPANAAAAAGVGQNPLLNLLTGGKGIGGAGGDLLGSFLTSGAGQALGLSSAVGGTAGIAADAVGLIPGGAAADVALTGAGAALSAAASFIPYVGAALAVASALGLFDKKPSPAKGQFEISSGTTGFEDNAFVSSRFGNLGFNDANTQQFSGDAAKAFDQLVGGAIDAFSSRFSKEQSDHFAEVLKTMTFDTFEGTFTTEDFLQKYGGQVLQQVVTAAFDVLNPALSSVIANFHGTADEVAKFANSLLAINDATSKVGNADFTKNVDAALADATQATADKVLALVTIVGQFGDSITGLGPKIEALDPAQMTAFIDALGGAQTALQTMAFINDNFTTSADKATAAQTLLATDFANLGLAVPPTHKAFLDLLNSFLDGTDAGNQMYASVAALAPLFVQVAGTADQAAAALAQQVQAGLDYYNQNVLTAQQQTDRRVGLDETALFNATKQGTLLNDVLTQLGLHVIPTTRQGIEDLVNATLAQYGADSDEYKQLLALIPTIGDLVDATGGFGDAMSDAATVAVQAASDIERAWTQIDDQLSQFATKLGNLGSLAGEAKDFGTQLSDAVLLYGDTVTKLQAKIAAALANPTALNQSNVQYVYTPELAEAQKALAGAQAELTEFNTLSAQYGADKAVQLVQLEDQYAKEKTLYAGNAAALAILMDNFSASWNDIINATQTGVNAVQQTIEDFIKSIEQVAQNTDGNAGQRFSIDLALGTAKQDALTTQLATASPTAAPGIQADLDKIIAYNHVVAGYIADFAIYTAQYGADIASQLVDLEKWRDDQKAVLTGLLVDDPTQLANALGILGTIVDDKWQKIIDGTNNGVNSTIDAMQRIADYLKGLVISDVSPLTPLQKVDSAYQAYQSELKLAQGGDTKALGDVTQFFDAFIKLDRDAYASSQKFIDDFNAGTAELGQLAGTQANGQPSTTDSNTAIVNALPVNSKIVSADDLRTEMATLAQKFVDAIAALANASTEDLQTATTELKQSLVAIQEELTAR